MATWTLGREQEGMRVIWQDGWAGQGGSGREVPLRRPGLGPTFGAAHWPSGTRRRRPYQRAQGQPVGVLGPHPHSALPAPPGPGEIPLRPFHEPRRAPPPKRPHPRSVPTPKAAFSPTESGRGQTWGSAHAGSAPARRAPANCPRRGAGASLPGPAGGGPLGSRGPRSPWLCFQLALRL